MQTSCARSMFGLCPLRSDRNASCGRPASVAARFVLQPRCFNCASTSSASRRLTGPLGFVLIAVLTWVLDSAVRDWAWRRPCVPARLCFRVTVERLGCPGTKIRSLVDRVTPDGGVSLSSVGSGFAPCLSSRALFCFPRCRVSPDFRSGRCTSLHACPQEAVCSGSVFFSCTSSIVLVVRTRVCYAREGMENFWATACPSRSRTRRRAM